MIPKDDEPKRALPIVGTLTTCTYSGPVTGSGRRQGAQTPHENNDRAFELLEIVVGGSPPVTYLYDRNTGRCTKKE